MARGSSAFDGIINDAANAWGVPQPLIKAVIEKESGFDPDAYRGEPQIGDASRGLMQLLYGTAQSLGFAGDASDLYDPTTNIRLGTRYLADLIKTAARYGYGVDSAISAYNAGFSSQRAGDGKRTGNTTAAPFINQAYVDGVIAAANAYAAEASGSAQQLPTVTTIAAPEPNANDGPTVGGIVVQLLVGFVVVLLVNHFSKD